VEFVAAVHRHLREGRIASNEMDGVLQVFDADCEQGYWRWLPLTDAVMTVARTVFRTLPSEVFLRTGDALHLACAQQYGLTEVFSSDKHLLRAAGAFGLNAKNVIPDLQPQRG
jgi:predicted nucleic acid-binding protein